MIANQVNVAPDVAAAVAVDAGASGEEEKSPMPVEDEMSTAFPSFVPGPEDLQQTMPKQIIMLALEKLKKVTQATDERSLSDFFTKHNLLNGMAIQKFILKHKCIIANAFEVGVDYLISYSVFLENWYKSFRRGGATADNEDKTLLKTLLLDTDFRSCNYDVLEYLERHVVNGVRRFRAAKKASKPPSESYKGPFSAICQSSGMGKTRLSLQLASRDHMHVIYMCCRKEKSGYPPRTDTIANYIDQHGAEATFWPVLFSAIMEEYCQRRLNVRDIQVRCEWLKRIVQNPDEADFWTKVIEICEERRSAADPKLQATKAIAALKQFVSEDYLVFVFDEASVLAQEKEVPWQATPTADTPVTVSILNRIRKSLREVGDMCNLFGLFMDTNSHISHLFPSDGRQYLTLSARMGDVSNEPMLVWPPFCVLPFCNPGKTSHMLSDTIQYSPLGTDSHDVVRVSFCPMTLALLSRPMIAMDAFHKIQSPQTFHTSDKVLTELVAFAKQKLLYRREWKDILGSDMSPIESDVAKLAVLGCRYFLSSTSSLHQQLLVRQHMATCFGISDDGKDLVVGYQSEPLLAEAAAQIMLLDGAFQVLLEALCGLAARGSLALPSGKGEIGEVVACFALSRAFDKASDRLRREQEASRGTTSTSSSSSSAAATTEPSPIELHSILCRPIPLVEVLVELYGPLKKTRARIVELLENNALRRGIVMFNHFVKGGPEPIRNVASYAALLRRGAALLCKNGESAKDIIIPVALPKSSGEEIDVWNPDSYILTTWEIQVKNWQAPFNFNTLVSQMVDTKTVDDVDIGFRKCVEDRGVQQQTKPDTTGTTDTASCPTVYNVPVLYTAFNTNANRATGANIDIGSVLPVDSHWIDVQSKGKPKSKKRKTTSGAPASKKPRSSGHDATIVTSPTTLQTKAAPEAEAAAEAAAETEEAKPAVQMQVVGMLLCGVSNFAVFTAEEKRLIKRLLKVSDDPMALLLEYHTNIQGVQPEAARQRVRTLRPECG